MKQVIFILLTFLVTNLSAQSVDSSDIMVYNVKTETIMAMRTCFIENESIEEILPYYHVSSISLYYSNYMNTKPDSIFFLTDTGYVKYPTIGEVIFDNLSGTVTYLFQSYLESDGTYYTGSFTTSTSDEIINVIIPNKEFIISWESKVKN